MKKAVSFKAFMKMIDALEDLLNNYEAGYTPEQWANKERTDKLRKAHVKEVWFEIKTTPLDCNDESEWDIASEANDEIHRRVEAFCDEEV